MTFTMLQRKPTGETLKCKRCGMEVTYQQLLNCKAQICPSAPDGGFTDISGATNSDLSWLNEIKRLRNSKANSIIETTLSSSSGKNLMNSTETVIDFGPKFGP